MMATTRERIDRWLGEILATAGAQPEGIQVVLVHAAVDQSQRPVKTWKLDESVADFENLVTDMDETVEADAEGLGGRQRYLFRALAKGKDLGSLTVRCDVRPDAGGAIDSEPATTAGVVAMLQRHAEGSTRMLLSGMGTIVESLKAQILTQNELLAQYQQQALNNFRMQEELSSRRTEHELALADKRAQLEIEAAKQAAEIERKNLFFERGLGQIQQLLPGVLYHLTNGQIGTAPSDLADKAEQEDKATLFASVTEEQIETWRETMSPEQFAAIMKEYQGYRGAAGTDPHARTGHSNRASARTDVEALVVATAERLYSALSGRRAQIESLATPFLLRKPLSELDTANRELVTAVAGEMTLAGRKQETSGAAVVDAEALWSAIIGSDPGALMAIAQAVRQGRPWAALAASDRLKVLMVARSIVAASGAARTPAEPPGSAPEEPPPMSSRRGRGPGRAPGASPGE